MPLMQLFSAIMTVFANQGGGAGGAEVVSVFSGQNPVFLGVSITYDKNRTLADRLRQGLLPPRAQETHYINFGCR